MKEIGLEIGTTIVKEHFYNEKTNVTTFHTSETIETNVCLQRFFSRFMRKSNKLFFYDESERKA